MTVVRYFATMTLLLVAIQLSCGARLAPGPNGGAVQRDASPSDAWVFVGAWPAQAGPSSNPREEIWVGSRVQNQWRRIRDRDVVSAADNIPESRELVQSLRAAAGRLPAVYRQLGSRQGAAPDAAVGKYLVVALGSGDAFEEWADEERFLDRTLVDAAHALIDRMRPPMPAAARPGSAWLQAVSVHEPILTILTRDNQIVPLAADAIAAASPLSRVVASPFSWTLIPAGPFRLTSTIALGPDNPSTIVRVRNHVFQILLQMSANSER
jgi:hypothetical protein